MNQSTTIIAMSDTPSPRAPARTSHPGHGRTQPHQRWWRPGGGSPGEYAINAAKSSTVPTSCGHTDGSSKRVGTHLLDTESLGHRCASFGTRDPSWPKTSNDSSQPERQIPGTSGLINSGWHSRTRMTTVRHCPPTAAATGSWWQRRRSTARSIGTRTQQVCIQPRSGAPIGRESAT